MTGIHTFERDDYAELCRLIDGYQPQDLGSGYAGISYGHQLPEVGRSNDRGNPWLFIAWNFAYTEFEDDCEGVDAPVREGVLILEVWQQDDSPPHRTLQAIAELLAYFDDADSTRLTFRVRSQGSQELRRRRGLMGRRIEIDFHGGSDA